MTKTLAIAAAAALTVLSGMTSFTPTAEAGGIRVGFGFPLGAFTARPTRGGYAYGGGSSATCKKKPSSSYASRSRPRSEPKVASKPRHEPKVASRHYEEKTTKRVVHKETKLASHNYSAPKKSRSVYRAENEETSSSTENNDEIETGSTGSNALIEQDAKNADITTVEIPADLPVETAAPVAEVPAPATVTPAAPATAETNVEAPAVTDAPAATTETPAPVVEEKSTKKSKTAKKEDCTKYIPSIGVTVSVGC